LGMTLFERKRALFDREAHAAMNRVRWFRAVLRPDYAGPFE